MKSAFRYRFPSGRPLVHGIQVHRLVRDPTDPEPTAGRLEVEVETQLLGEEDGVLSLQLKAHPVRSEGLAIPLPPHLSTESLLVTMDRQGALMETPVPVPPYYLVCFPSLPLESGMAWSVWDRSVPLEYRFMVESVSERRGLRLAATAACRDVGRRVATRIQASYRFSLRAGRLERATTVLESEWDSGLEVTDVFETRFKP